VKPGDVDVDVLRALTNISGVPMPTINMSPAERRRLDDAMGWLRNNDPIWTTLMLRLPRRLETLLV
jgi:hypothetical protein